MCRMVALRTDDASVRREVLVAFRNQASRGFTGPESQRRHPDGWGLAGVGLRGLAHLGRSPVHAGRDPAYLPAVEKARDVRPGTFVLGHVRNGSVGTNRVENNHPFIREGWAFAHNGTIRGDLPIPDGWQTEGDTDSERYFLHILDAWKKKGNMDAAIRTVVPAVAAQYRHSSLTFLLTDGKELYAFRKVGPDPGSCGTLECAFEHYVIGHGTYRGATVVSQEPEFLPQVEEWTEVPDGTLMHFPARGEPRATPLLKPLLV